MITSPVSPIPQRANQRFQKALGVQLTRLYAVELAEPPSATFLCLLAEADRLGLPEALKPHPSTTPRSKLTLFG
jgi:hypothetical protein